MKVSTARSNDRASSTTTKVIICYCGPTHDEENVVKYGTKDLVSNFPPSFLFPYFTLTLMFICFYMRYSIKKNRIQQDPI